VYTLYGYKRSGSAAVEVALGRTKSAYRVVNAASWDPDSALAELAKLNSLKQIPTLITPHGDILTESAAILIHLGLEFPGSAILPSATRRRDQAIRGLVFIAANCYSAVSIIDFPERWLEDADDLGKGRLIRGTRQRLYRHWEIFADQFDCVPYLGGEEPGALDFLAAVVCKWSGARQHLRVARPEFFATLERIEQHSEISAVFGQHWDV
jgi:GST-like protein